MALLLAINSSFAVAFSQGARGNPKHTPVKTTPASGLLGCWVSGLPRGPRTEA